MLLTFDTNAGAFRSTVPNYVEGSGESIEIILPLYSELCPECIGELMTDVEQYVQGNLHGLYAILDQMKGKHLRRALADVYAQMQAEWEEMGAILVFIEQDDDNAEEFHSLSEDLRLLGHLMAAKKNEIKDRLKLVNVIVDPVGPEITLCFGVDEISFPVLSLSSCNLDI